MGKTATTRDAGGNNVSQWSESAKWEGGYTPISPNRGRSHILDPRKRTAPPVGGNFKSKKQKARSSVTPW